jgi:Zn/Cd-binding protein ZinT
MGIVVEERTSELPGGFCYVRINFNDGNVRVFDNNLKSECCCYYAGIEIIESKKKSIGVDMYEESENPQKKRKALTRGKG